MDIEQFFPSISRVRVCEIFRSLGYNSRLSNFLAHLLTLDEALPQGAPTSPAISSIILKAFDESVERFCAANNLIYSRYADDIAISSRELEIGELVKSNIEDFLKQHGFSP
ncbi:reverse transcriptase domain-containing protein, partial [Paraburkholderia sediminicola]|uniref:reverse transcriptase domain-containing protein n=1 Tax=Paraburkholderia sediminicola TaxID=458836 RepID=UPI0038BD0B13